MHSVNLSTRIKLTVELDIKDNDMNNVEAYYPPLAPTYKDFDILVPDINHEKLDSIGSGEKQNLSPGTFSSSPFPVTGRILQHNLRFMIPLVCRGGGSPSSKSAVIWFLVDTTSPFTCLSLKSLECLFGEAEHDQFYRVAIQDQKSEIMCEVSKGHFEEVNILGTDALRYLRLSIVADWNRWSFKLAQL